MPGVSLKLNAAKVIRSCRCILDIEDLLIEPGQFVNIIGTNGAGKTTLLKLLCGLIKPSSGNIYFDQTPINNINSWSRSNLKKQIGYIPQSAEYNAQLPFTLREIVLMGRTSAKRLFAGLNKNDYGLADEWIERVGLSSLKNQTFSSLSGGEQQKVLIARAMAQKPKILMLDEPTSNLDFHWKGRISSLVQDLHKQLGITVLMISHELTSVPLETQRTILLDAGKVIADGPSQDVMTSDIIQQVYNCKIMLHQVDGNKYIINQPLP